jgi:GT2 family glycosyltransferase
VAARVTAIVVNFNGNRCVTTCLHSLLTQSSAPEKILVVDNASSDGSPQQIQNQFPSVEILQLDENIGFPAACNLGIRSTSSELIAILNNDVRLEPNWLRSLLSKVSDPWDFWASRILFADDPSMVDSAGDGMAVVGAAYKIGHGDSADRYAEPREVFGPCAAAALYRRSMLLALGGFDEAFFLVYEDADLNLRARLRGHRCLYVPEAIAHHMLNTSIGTFSHHYVFYGHRNSEHLFWKNMPASLLWRYLPERLLFDFVSFVYFTLKGRGLSFLQAKLDFLSTLPRLIRKRREIQTTRALSGRELRPMLDRNWLKFRRKVVVQS